MKAVIFDSEKYWAREKKGFYSDGQLLDKSDEVLESPEELRERLLKIFEQ